MKQVAGYNIEQLGHGMWAIDGKMQETMYLIEGREKALLIDTGVTKGEILPMLRTLTQKPVELALTHAHIDHMYHADEFDKVYLHQADIAAWDGVMGLLMKLGTPLFMKKKKTYNVKGFIPMDESTEIDLGDLRIRVFNAFGHTPGSVVFVDDMHKTVFMGDAVGSGTGVWLWLPGCSSVRTYEASMEHLCNVLQPYRDYTFLSGHRMQCSEKAQEKMGAVPMNLQVVEDMTALCHKILTGACGATKKIGFIRFYQEGHAALLVRKSLVNRNT